MSDTGKQSPLGVNALTSLLVNKGLCLNPPTVGRVGTSHSYSSYDVGSVVDGTCLRLLTFAIRDGWVNRAIKLTDETYNMIYTIGSREAIGINAIAALGNSKAQSYTWTGWPKWVPYTLTNPYANELTSWGYIRLFALQAWNEFNYNSSQPEIRDFLLYFSTAHGFIEYSNNAILSVDNSTSFLNGAYSNMDDLISADVTGVNKATPAFGQDLINLGKALDLSTIDTFGLPSNLLFALAKASALSDAVNLAILASGISPSELADILNKVTRTTVAQEQKMYRAFTIVIGIDLDHVMSTLTCTTKNIKMLADLLNPAKLFPVSGVSLTVPVFNKAPGTISMPYSLNYPNSKVYYPIYTAAMSLNSALTSPAIKKQIGTLIPAGTPETAVKTISPVPDYNPPTGFGSYLIGILPDDVAVAAGAFAVAMGNIRNIRNVPMALFANMVYNIETIRGLNINGTTIPTDMPSVAAGLPLIALGSGPQGSYTMSDFLGCMSGLPYPWDEIQSYINQVETKKLYNIYHELYLAVTWEKAALNINQQVGYERTQDYIAPSDIYGPDPLDPFGPYIIVGTNPGQPAIYDLYYTANISMNSRGGGYSRGTAPNPVVTMSPNNISNVVMAAIDTKDRNVPGTFGRIIYSIGNSGNKYYYATDVEIWSATPPDQSMFGGAYSPPMETVSVAAPPTDDLPVQADGKIATGGLNTIGDTYNTYGSIVTGTTGWRSPMNTVTQKYILQANTEIAAIQVSKQSAALELNKRWYNTGVQLFIEQRAITVGIPLPVPL